MSCGGVFVSGLCFVEEPDGRLHYPVSQILIVVDGGLALEVLEVCPAEVTAQGVEVKVDVFVPGLFERTEQVASYGGTFGATEAVRFPDLCEDVFEGGRNALIDGGHFADAVAKLPEAAMFDAGDFFFGQGKDLGDVLVVQAAIEEQLGHLQVAKVEGLFEAGEQFANGVA